MVAHMSLSLCTRRYVGTIFVLFGSPPQFEKCHEYLNTKHANIKSSINKEVIWVITIFACANMTE